MEIATSVSIRPATIDDYDGVAVVFDQIHQLHLRALPHFFRETDEPALDRAYFESALADSEVAWLVAERAGEIVGLVDVRIPHAPDRAMLTPRQIAEVRTLAVRSDNHRAGAGRALMAAAERWAAERGLHEIELSVWEFNQGAIAFYTELGYVTERRKMRRVISDANS